MRHTILAAALAASTLLAAVPARAETEHVTKTLALDAGGTLRLKSFSGRVTITATDRTDVSIDAYRHASRAQLAAIKLDIRAEGSSTIVIEANQHEHSWLDFARGSNVVETDFNIQVPRRINLDVSVFSAPVTTTGIEGTQNVHTFDSQLKLEEAAGAVEAHSFSGAIEIGERTWQGHETLDVHTFSGAIAVRLPASARANVAFDSFSGHLNSDLPLMLDSSSRRGVRGHLGSGEGGELKLKTFSGDVRIETTR